MTKAITLTHWTACFEGNDAMKAVLKREGTGDILSLDPYGRTAIDIAEYWCKDSVVKILREALDDRK